MAIPAIPPLSIATSFIPPLTQPRELAVQDAFTQVLGTSLSGAPISLAALTSASSGTQSLAALEQALFADWLASIQNADLSSLSSALDPLLAGQLGLIATPGAGTSQSVLNATTGQSLGLTSALVSLFNTIQLLGTDANQPAQVGSLLDLLA
jgi:hypothetical protein